MKRIGIATIFTGYNYGSCLQAYATKCIIENIGYKAEILKLSGSIKRGRDIRLKKLAVIAIRSLLHCGAGKKAAMTYYSSMSARYSEKTMERFDRFCKELVAPRVMSYGKLKRTAKTNDYSAFVCGSDQVWNATTMYVDPFYYLSFAPRQKRIAFAPSFGKDAIPSYNIRVITNRIKDIPYLSVRETQGKKLIKDLTGREAEVLIDPTLVLSSDEWAQLLEPTVEGEKYTVAYFLDAPSEAALKMLRFVADSGQKIIRIPYAEESNCGENVDAGPVEFLNLIRNAEIVLTDSFHGTAFAVNFHKKFYAFSRMYGNAANQSSRLVSLLKLLQIEDRFDPDQMDLESEIDFGPIEAILKMEREKSYSYLRSAFYEVDRHGT